MADQRSTDQTKKTASPYLCLETRLWKQCCRLLEKGNIREEKLELELQHDNFKPELSVGYLILNVISYSFRYPAERKGNFMLVSYHKEHKSFVGAVKFSEV